MSEYRVDVRIRNNLILNKIAEKGYKSIADMCKQNQVEDKAAMIREIVRFAIPPIDASGSMRPEVFDICMILECTPEDIFTPAQLYVQATSNTKTYIFTEEALKLYMEDLQDNKSLEHQVLEDQQNVMLRDAVKTLTAREQKLITAKFGLDGNDPMTLEQLGKLFNVSANRARQIEAVALRKLRHPSRTQTLKESIYDNEEENG